MPFREPSWWYAEQATPAARLLTPLAHLYGSIVVKRMQRTSAYACALPVVCIGNFTAGGTGKTPLAIFLARQIRQQGLAPVFLTRGYGSAVRDPTIVDLTRHRSSDVGDEALLLARAAPVMVAPDRAAGARAIVESSLTCDVILMDDGLQNPSLKKDLRIAVVDGARRFGNRCVIPAGPLRAPLEPQLAHVDLVVVNGGLDDREAVGRLIAPFFTGAILSAHQSAAGDTEWLRDGAIVAFAGIGNPDRFFHLLRSLGAHLALELSFADHHAFSEQDAVKLLAQAKRLGARLVTTEKDLVRLTGQAGARGELGRQAQPLAISLSFHDDQAGELFQRTLDVIATR